MNKFFSHLIRLGIISFALLTVTPVAAEESSTPQISAQLYKQLAVTDKLIAKQAYKGARQRLQKYWLA